MKVVVGSNEEISKLIAEEFIKQVQKKPNSVLGLATGTSPIEVYANMIKANKEGRVSFKQKLPEMKEKAAEQTKANPVAENARKKAQEIA